MKNKIKIIIFIFLVLLSSADSISAAAPADKIEDIVADYGKAVVSIAVRNKEGAKVGSGFVIDKDGLILTNYHIVHQAQGVFVKFKDKKAYQATVIKIDPDHDIAVLRIRRDGLKAVRLGSSHSLNVGQRVMTIGHPLGLENTVSDGLISAVRKMENGSKLLQISVPLSPGSSGGPLFDLQGKVIGITTSSFNGGQNLNFAVPISYAKSLLRETKNKSVVSEKPMRRLARSSDTASYTVQEKDTLYSLSRRFNVSVDTLKSVNNLSDATIHPGQVLRVPEAQ